MANIERSAIVRFYFARSAFDALWKLLRTSVGVVLDLLTFFRLMLRAPQAVAAENLFPRKQLAFYVERKRKPHRATAPFVSLWPNFSRFFEWRDTLKRFGDKDSPTVRASAVAKAQIEHKKEVMQAGG